MKETQRSPTLLAVTALGMAVLLACSAKHDSSGDDVDDENPTCGLVQLSDVALGIGGFVLDGEAAEDLSGSSANGAGDVNGDGLADITVGALGAEPNGPESGRAYVVFGKADTDKVPLADVARGLGGFVLDGEAPDDSSGRSVGGVDDVNGDGLDDIVVGAVGAASNGLDFAGRTYVVFGKADTEKVPLAEVTQGVGGFSLDGEAGGDASGRTVGGAGDVNGDGIADIIVGASGADPNGTESGRAYVVFGKADTDKVLLADVTQGIGGFALDGEALEDNSGVSVSGAGDVNGDGLADVIVGASGADPSGTDSGRAYVVFGKEDTDKVLLADVAQGIGGFALDGEEPDDHSGISVSGVGDVNGDGLADVMVGAPGADANTPHSGRTYVVFGKADTDKVRLADVAQGIGGFALDGEPSEESFGMSLSGGGDVDGDGLADVVVGDAAAGANGRQSGRTYVVFGKKNTDRVSLADVAQGIGGFALDGADAADGSGLTVNLAGDVNGDELADVVVGAPWAGPNGDRSGRTYVVFGGDLSCAGI